MKFQLTVIAALVAAAGSAASAQDIRAWDRDSDGVLGQDEFSQGFFDTDLFETWDLNEDDLLDFTEFSETLYVIWDADDDGDLSADEWDDAVDAWFGEQAVNLDLAAWDDDDDGVISRDEFAEALRTTDLLSRLDTLDEDEMIGEDELASGVFDVADIDGDEAIGEGEKGFFSELGDFFTVEEDPSADIADQEGLFEEDPPLIERGEAFTALPVPCGDTSCEAVAQDFCKTLGYGEPLDFLEVQSQLYTIRCKDEF